ncbi:MAG: cache domain-containing protein, partial [Sulfurospirillaceae bacterium]|nr:cache domain-containing protein [Sulfurospirillaceae bacterium]
MQFKTKITLTISILMFLSLTTFGLFSYLDTKKNSVAQVEKSLVLASNALTDYIDMWALNKKNVMQSTARSLTDIEIIDSNQIRAILQETTLTLGGFDTTVGLEDGSAMTGSGAKLPEGYDPRVRGWYKTVKASGKAGVTDAYIDATTKKLVVSVMAPIFKDKVFIGAVILDISLDVLTKAVADVNFNG